MQMLVPTYLIESLNYLFKNRMCDNHRVICIIKAGDFRMNEGSCIESIDIVNIIASITEGIYLEH